MVMAGTQKTQRCTEMDRAGLEVGWGAGATAALWEQHYHKRELSACVRLSPRPETPQGKAPGLSNPGRGRRREVPRR